MHCCCSRMPIVIRYSIIIMYKVRFWVISVKFVLNTIKGTGKDGCDEWYLDGESKFK